MRGRCHDGVEGRVMTLNGRRVAVLCTFFTWGAQPCLAFAREDRVRDEPPVVGGVPASASLGASSIEDTPLASPQSAESLAGRVSGFRGWAFNVPLGSVRKFTGVVSPLGFELQFSGWVTKTLSLGVSGEWATYVDNRRRTTYSLESGALTATAYNYMQTTSARLLIHYCFLGQGPIQPYIGPHVGVSWSSFDSEAADLVLSDSEVSVNFGGEAGVQIPFGPNAPAVLVNFRYSMSPAAEFRHSVSNVQSIGMLLGLGF
jgi:hypothetical protein